MNELEPRKTLFFLLVFLHAIHMKIFVICHFGPHTFHMLRVLAVLLTRGAACWGQGVDNFLDLPL